MNTGDKWIPRFRGKAPRTPTKRAVIDAINMNRPLDAPLMEVRRRTAKIKEDGLEGIGEDNPKQALTTTSK